VEVSGFAKVDLYPDRAIESVVPDSVLGTGMAGKALLSMQRARCESQHTSLY